VRFLPARGAAATPGATYLCVSYLIKRGSRMAGGDGDTYRHATTAASLPARLALTACIPPACLPNAASYRGEHMKDLYATATGGTLPFGLPPTAGAPPANTNYHPQGHARYGHTHAGT